MGFPAKSEIKCDLSTMGVIVKGFVSYNDNEQLRLCVRISQKLCHKSSVCLTFLNISNRCYSLNIVSVGIPYSTINRLNPSIQFNTKTNSFGKQWQTKGQGLVADVSVWINMKVRFLFFTIHCVLSFT